ncbi:hypothetical protein Back2_08720 [Nocardioides baekrokdamisoli]|uniref:DUF3618 domain-containing protein n=1 Tax=Nocardioides baekrokdamisoli TaxID=1804624 RepID=A0A3G9IKI2_9ACTN|nr:DUF3618 domain-containing protein [Nocardioides baekrokdamisoli]BBH16585.1 hypothetical protein Back2_08720 [Nocardioides baekrokdamisoli]
MAKDITVGLEREIEEARERLAVTIDQLLYQASPKTILSRRIADVKAIYVDPATGQLNTTAVAATVGGFVGVIGLVVAVRKIRN